jgi:DNA processing protein
MPLTNEERDLLALHLVPGIGPRLCEALLARFGSARAVLKAPTAALCEVPHVGPKVAGQIQQSLADPQRLQEESNLIDEHGVSLRFLGRPDYPATLALTSLPPHLLYVKGTLRANDERAIAVVGSRGCTSYGRRVAERFAHDFAKAGWTVVSGLARGIDGCAHRGALEAGGRTVAVLAGGLSRIYPPEHTDMAQQIAETGGALVSEAPMRMEPMAALFPARNRIISGLCRGVIVVEANEKSGALITARLAGEQGREVFAVPGPVDSAASAGSLWLLRTGAKLVRKVDDVLEDLQALPGLLTSETTFETSVVAPELNDLHKKIWQHLDEKRTVDELTRHLGLTSAEVAQQLMLLELRKVVRRLPGNWYERA